MAGELSAALQYFDLQAMSLGEYDILSLNFAAARGLPGTEKSSLSHWLAKRDEWLARIKFELHRHIYRVDPRSQVASTEYTYGNSIARFICYIMLQVLQEDCGVQYHPDRKFKPDHCQPRDVFAHGIMDDDGEGGTCASMPVVYVSVGRALGLPLWLVETRGHAFVRWDSPEKGVLLHWPDQNFKLWVPPDRFNVEGSGEGIAYHNDTLYTQWPELWTQIDVSHGRYLLSMTPLQALAGFLMERGECFWDLHRQVEALQSYHYACQLVPEDMRYKVVHAHRSRQYQVREAQERFIEDQFRKANQKQLGLPVDHPQHCACVRCRERERQSTQPPHGPSCQCLHCRKAREAQVVSQGMPGHPSSCQCAWCRQHFHLPVANRANTGAMGHPPFIHQTNHHADF